MAALRARLLIRRSGWAFMAGLADGTLILAPGSWLGSISARIALRGDATRGAGHAVMTGAARAAALIAFQTLCASEAPRWALARGIVARQVEMP